MPGLKKKTEGKTLGGSVSYFRRDECRQTDFILAESPQLDMPKNKVGSQDVIHSLLSHF